MCSLHEVTGHEPGTLTGLSSVDLFCTGGCDLCVHTCPNELNWRETLLVSKQRPKCESSLRVIWHVVVHLVPNVQKQVCVYGGQEGKAMYLRRMTLRRLIGDYKGGICLKALNTLSLLRLLIHLWHNRCLPLGSRLPVCLIAPPSLLSFLGAADWILGKTSCPYKGRNKRPPKQEKKTKKAVNFLIEVAQMGQYWPRDRIKLFFLWNEGWVCCKNEFSRSRFNPICIACMYNSCSYSQTAFCWVWLFYMQWYKLNQIESSLVKRRQLINQLKMPLKSAAWLPVTAWLKYIQCKFKFDQSERINSINLQPSKKKRTVLNMRLRTNCSWSHISPSIIWTYFPKIKPHPAFIFLSFHSKLSINFLI